jgi:hypothetical protein
MKWKFKWDDNYGDEWWEARRQRRRYAVCEESRGFAAYVDEDESPDWHYLGTWPSEKEAKAAVEQNRVFPKVT